MTGWEQDKCWSDRYMTHIKSVLGIHLIGPAPVEDDQERNTDLVVLKMDSVRVACRIRREEYATRYADEFTIRVNRPSNNKTELTKIIEGWGDYFFYGFGRNGSDQLASWTLADLKVFRLWFNQQLYLCKGVAPGRLKDNHDRSSSFRAFKWSELPGEFIVARSITTNENQQEDISHATEHAA